MSFLFPSCSSIFHPSIVAGENVEIALQLVRPVEDFQKHFSFRTNGARPYRLPSFVALPDKVKVLVQINLPKSGIYSIDASIREETIYKGKEVMVNHGPHEYSSSKPHCSITISAPPNSPLLASATCFVDGSPLSKQFTFVSLSSE